MDLFFSFFFFKESHEQCCKTIIFVTQNNGKPISPNTQRSKAEKLKIKTHELKLVLHFPTQLNTAQRLRAIATAKDQVFDIMSVQRI